MVTGLPRKGPARWLELKFECGVPTPVIVSAEAAGSLGLPEGHYAVTAAQSATGLTERTWSSAPISMW